MSRSVVVVTAAAGPLVAIVLSGASCQVGSAEPCAPELSPRGRVELRFVEPYTEDGGYLWRPYPGADALPSCAGRDGLIEGTYEFVTEERAPSGFGCRPSILIAVTPIGDVTFPPDRIRVMPFLASVQTPYLDGYWKLGVEDLTPETSPFGERAIPGRFPPVRVSREILSGSRGSCFDLWVGEIRVLPGSIDGGPG